MKYRVDVIRASSFCSDAPPTGQCVIVKSWNLSATDGVDIQVFRLEPSDEGNSIWSDEHFENFPFFNPIGMSFNPAERHEVCDGYLLRKFANFNPLLADQFASYFSAVECLLVPVK